MSVIGSIHKFADIIIMRLRKLLILKVNNNFLNSIHFIDPLVNFVYYVYIKVETVTFILLMQL